jgi:nucleoside-diphosphate-sugar epimerase
VGIITDKKGMSSPSKKVLVTGASGFIGQHALPELAARGYEVYALARNSTKLPGNIVAVRGDLLRPGEPERVIDIVNPSHLLHLAWNATPGQFWTALDNLDWVAASLRLSVAFAKSGGRRVVCAGSCAEYDWDQELLKEDETPLRPRTLYGKAKASFHQLLMEAAAQTGVSAAWGHVFFLYGPHEHSGRLIPQVISGLLRGSTVACTAGTQERDFMHVSDVASGLVALLDSDWQGAANIASGHCAPIRDALDFLAGLAGRDDLIQFGARPTPANDPPRMAASTRALSEIGFVPKYGLNDGLLHTFEWWRRQQSSAS